jgi:hypothetical protein
MKCAKCQQPMPNAAYGSFCEDCYVDTLAGYKPQLPKRSVSVTAARLDHTQEASTGSTPVRTTKKEKQ